MCDVRRFVDIEVVDVVVVVVVIIIIELVVSWFWFIVQADLQRLSN